MRAINIKCPSCWVLIVILVVLLSGCASFGPTKPNPVFEGPYPPRFYELAGKNALLSGELGKLPEIQDGVSPAEAAALERIVDVYDSNSLAFDSAFKRMYQVGKPDVRKYCSPLQALFWLAEDDELSSCKDLILNYSLERLLNKAWPDPLSCRILSDSQIKEVIDGIENEYLRTKYLDDLQNGITYAQLQHDFVSDYRSGERTHIQIFSKKSAKIIKEKLLTPKAAPRWEDHNEVIERLNAPELLDFYINRNIRYDHKIPRFHRSPRSVISEKYGDCDDLAYFGKTVLTKAGYDVFGRILGHERSICHIGLGIKLEDGSYLLAVHFNRSRNHMSGPYKTLLELDRALGYGHPHYPKLRGPFNFNWLSR